MTVRKYGQFIFVLADGLTGSTASTWEQIVFSDLRELDRSQTGACLLRFLQRQCESVTILPYLDTNPQVQATARALVPSDAYYPSRPVRHEDTATRRAPTEIGTGMGSASVIRFTPWRFKWAGSAVVVLLHELMHATANAAGRAYHNPIEHGFDTQAEFDAILVENCFRSERGMNLRKNHHGFDKLDGSMAPAGEYRTLVRSFRARLPVLAAQLGTLRTPFNPFRPGADGFVAV